MDTLSISGRKTIDITVARDGQDKRFDAALFALLEKQFPGRFSRSGIGRMIRDGLAFRNGNTAKPGTPVSLGDTLTLILDEESPISRLTPHPDLPVTILDETADFIALSKPAGLQTHPANKDSGDTLANWLVAHYPEIGTIGEHPYRPGIVHRLDRDTSGVMVVAKTENAFQELKKAFHDRLAEKTYAALVFGNLKELSGTINFPLGQRSGELRRRIDDGTIANARPAVTDYRVIARYKGCDLILAMPKTGRTHQIRAHMAAIGHPVIGDQLYASKDSRGNAGIEADRQLLHAWRLSLPFFGQKMHFQAPLPADFKNTLRSIDPDTYFDEDSYQQIIGSR